MDHWNYRIVLKDDVYGIHEVYYDAEGQVRAFTEQPVYPCGETLAELREDLEHFQQTFDRVVLNYEELSAQLVGPELAEEAKAAEENFRRTLASEGEE